MAVTATTEPGDTHFPGIPLFRFPLAPASGRPDDENGKASQREDKTMDSTQADLDRDLRKSIFDSMHDVTGQIGRAHV